ncbi:acyl-coenzyme A oxidase 3, peroxisomal-like isoform X2 [Lotus japonicus]|uniref:acyl-coenzyme A oxidase 3, peroxisomal-like isoform X2 n=1 Tax=Lotus japonicus TaxID=34305 RepID=UPI00258792C7|nr:acyl-coenzyme A oxidase 3, peroxisomal-like isoform X2 [Lotus japonicus]
MNNYHHRVSRRIKILRNHLRRNSPPATAILNRNNCLSYSPPELSDSNPITFDVTEMRRLTDGHNLDDRDRLFGLITQSGLFNRRELGGRVFVSPDYNQSMEQQREMTMKRIEYLFDRGVFRGWLTGDGPRDELRKLALHEVIGMYDHSLAIMLGVFLWSEELKQSLLMIQIPENSSSILHVNRLRSIGLVVQQMFDNARIPRENLLNSVADVSSSGEYLSAIKNADQRFAAFLSPLTYGRVTISVGAVYISKIALAITIRYALTRRAFSIAPNGPEVLLLDYPSHQRRLLPLLAKVYAMSFAAIELKMMYANRTPESKKAIHIFSSAYKATFTWNNMRTLQECREACGGQGVKTENRIGHFMSEFDVHSTFEGDNNVLMQQMSKTLLAEYITRTTKNEPFRGLGLEHMNKPWPVIPSQLTSSAIRSSEFQIDLFHLRERDLLRRFAAEVSEYQSHGKSKESAFILSYQLAEDLGRAFSERAILKTFMEAESTLSAGSVKNVLGLLRSLYAMMCVDEDASFLRYGYLSIENASAVRKEVPKLCSELRPLALALVSSFGIPDAFLSPIAYNWVDSNSWDLSQH